MKCILYLEDELILSKLVINHLEHFYSVSHATSLDEVDLYLNIYSYDIAILDRNINNVDIGLNCIKMIHSINSKTRIIITNSYSTIDDKIKCLKLGADDYLEKPFNIRELTARIDVLLRNNITESIFYEDIKFDTSSKQIYHQKKLILLSQKENNLLFYLLSNSNRVFTPQELIYALYRHPDNILPNTIAATISKIRKKLPISIIKTIKTRGYMIEI